MVEPAELYMTTVELARGPLGTLSVGQGAERAVLLRTVSQREPWSAELLDAWAASSSRARSLHHPSLLSVIDVVRSPDSLVVVTEYVQGVPLSLLMARARERGRPIPPELARRVVLDLARSATHTHELLSQQGDSRPLSWIHPESVLVTSGDDALIADVGLLALQHVAEAPELEAFRAPELFSRGEVTPSSAVYSLGVLLWELLAGREALGEGSQAASISELRERARAGAIPRLDLVAPNAPPLLVGIVNQALHRDPGGRFPDVTAFAETLSVGKRGAPGELVRFMNELCGDLIDAERGAVVRPQVAATSWRPTVHPMDDVAVPEIPRAPKALSLGGLGPAPASPVVVISDKDEVSVAAPLPLTRAPQATLPLMLVKKATPAAHADAPSIEIGEAAPDDDAEAEWAEQAEQAEQADDAALEPAPARRGGFVRWAFVALVVASAGALVFVALREQRAPSEPESAESVRTPTTPSASAAERPGTPEPAAGASAVQSASSAARPSRADPPLTRSEREERRARREQDDAGVAPSSTWGKVEEEPVPNSDNPYAEPAPPSPTPPAPSTKFGY